MHDERAFGKGIIHATRPTRRIHLPERQLAEAEDTPDESLLHDNRLHAIDRHAVEPVLEKAALDLDAVAATARLEASEGDAGAERRHHPHEQGQRDEPDNDKGDEAVAEKREARVGEHFRNGSASLARHLRDEVGDPREHADDADDDENQRRAVRKSGENELAVGYAVLEGDAPRVDLAPGEYAAHVVPHLGRRIEHVAEAARGVGFPKGRPDGRRLASEQVGPQRLRVGLAQKRHRHSLVRRAARRVDPHRAHAEHALEKRGCLVDRLDAPVGHMHALFVEDARIKAEFLVAELVPNVLVGHEAVDEARGERDGDRAQKKQDDDNSRKPAVHELPEAVGVEQLGDDLGKRADKKRREHRSGTLKTAKPDVAGMDRVPLAILAHPAPLAILAVLGPVHHMSSRAIRASSAARSRTWSATSFASPGMTCSPAAVATVTLESPKARRIGPWRVSVFWTRMKGMM